MSRTPSHVIETKARDYIRSVIDNYYENGDAIFRELSERDYGIDGLIELFSNGDPTGQIALVQIKGTTKTIQPLKRQDVVSCQISISNAKYALQNNLPIILLYVSITKPEGFYYVDINKIVNSTDLTKNAKQESIAIHIPIENNALEDLEPLFENIRNFYRQGENTNVNIQM